MKRQEVLVKGPRELVFEVVAAAGKRVGEHPRGELVEFESKWRGRVIKTVEAVDARSPERILYEWVEGPLEGVQEEIAFEGRGPQTTLMTYKGRIRSPENVLGWLRTLLVVRPVFNRLVSQHLEEGKRLAEARARRSRRHPR